MEEKELMVLRQALEIKKRNEELQNQFYALNMAAKISDLATRKYEFEMAYRNQVIKRRVCDVFQQPLMILPYCNTQRIKELKLLLSIVRSDEEKLQVQSRFNDFLKTKIPSPPIYDIIASAGSRSSDALRTLQRAVSQEQEQEHSSTRYSAFEDADYSSPDGNAEGQAESISLKPSKKTRRK